jgi:hypothetical protein
MRDFFACSLFLSLDNNKDGKQEREKKIKIEYGEREKKKFKEKVGVNKQVGYKNKWMEG